MNIKKKKSFDELPTFFGKCTEKFGAKLLHKKN